MVALVIVAAVSAQGAAASAFALRPETSHVRLLAQNEGALTPPPMPPPLTEPPPRVEPPPPMEVPPPAAFAPPTPSARLVDSDANSVDGHEVLVGFLSGLGVHLVAGGALAFGFIFLLGAAFGGSGGAGFAVAALGALLVGFVIELLSPLLTAYFESLAADERRPMAGSFGKSVGLAYAAFGTAIVLDLVLQALTAGVAGSSAVAGLVGLVSLAMFLVGVPVAASFGRHFGPATPEGATPPASELFPRTDPLFAALPKPPVGLGVSLSF